MPRPEPRDPEIVWRETIRRRMEWANMCYGSWRGRSFEEFCVDARFHTGADIPAALRRQNQIPDAVSATAAASDLTAFIALRTSHDPSGLDKPASSPPARSLA